MWLMISVYQGKFPSAAFHFILYKIRRGYHDHVAAPFREWILEHCFHFLYGTCLKRVNYGCFRNYYVVCINGCHQCAHAHDYAGICTWLYLRLWRSFSTLLAWYFYPNTLVCPRFIFYGRKLTPWKDLTFVLSVRFAWKVALIVAVSSLPLYIIKLIRSRVAPASSSKLV
jgi:hypothetical protein